LVAELLLKVSLTFVWVLDEAVVEVIDDRSTQIARPGVKRESSVRRAASTQRLAAS
jgi:hypothetical protein